MTQRRLQKSLHICMILMMISGLMGAMPVRAEAEPSGVLRPPAAEPTPPGPELRYGYAEDGRVNFIGGSSGSPLLSGAEGVSAMSDVDAAEAVLAQYGPEFGLQDPLQELKLDRSSQDEQGSTLRYRQEFAGIPVLGGEMLVNRDEYGNILSLNGEVSPGLAPAVSSAVVSAEQAQQKAAAGAQEWYGLAAENIGMTPPELWWYDERIFKPGNEPVTLTWRMELTALDGSQLVRELVLVDAVSGEIVLHFNQIDTSWHKQAESPAGTETPVGEPAAEPTVEATLEPTLEPVVTETPLEQPTGTAEPPAGEPVAGQAGVVWYVSPTGNDANGCKAPETPCQSIMAAIGKSSSGDIIKITADKYLIDTNQKLIRIRNSILLSGGWNHEFGSQTGHTVLEGGNLWNTIEVSGINPNVQIDHFIMEGFEPSGSQIIYVGASDSLELTNSAIINNHAYRNSGLVYIDENATFVCSNVTIAHNLSTPLSGDYPPGFAITGHSPKKVVIKNSTIVNNQLERLNDQAGVGLYIKKSNSSSQNQPIIPEIIIQNSIIANNSAGQPADIYSPDYLVRSAGHNIIGAYNGSNLIPAESDFFGQDPLLGEMQTNGVLAPLPSSLAIDHGSPDIPGSSETACETTDQVGSARPIDGNRDGLSVCDIGAYEVVSPLPGDPAQIELLPQAMVFGKVSEAYLPLSVKVTDAFGWPVGGATVSVTAPESGPSGAFQNDLGTHVMVVTNNDGIVVLPSFIANDIPGQFSLHVEIQNYPLQADFVFENYLPIPSSLQLLTGGNQIVGPTMLAEQPFRVFVKDQHDFPMADVQVVFNAPLEGSSGTFIDTGTHQFSSITNLSGEAVTAKIKANGIPGNYEIAVSVQDSGLTISIPIANKGLFVSQGGSDQIDSQPNNCALPASPCKTFAQALSNKSAGITIYSTAEEFENGVIVLPQYESGQLIFSGGWSPSFSAVVGKTILTATLPNLRAFITYRFQVGLSNFQIENYAYGFSGQSESWIKKSVFMNNQVGLSLGSEWKVEDSGIINNATGIVNGGTGVVKNSVITSILSRYQSGIAISNFKNLKIIHSTIGTKTAKYEILNKGTLSLKGNILFGSVRPFGENSGQIYSFGSNLIQSTTLCENNKCGYAIFQTSDLIGIDPRLGLLTDHRYLPLLPESPAIDAAASLFANSDCLGEDIRGLVRPINGKCDIGSYEYQPAGSPVRILMSLESGQSVLPHHDLYIPIRFIVIDQNGSPVPGVAVQITAPNLGASGVFKSNGLNSIEVITGQDGSQLTPVFRTNEVEGEIPLDFQIIGLATVESHAQFVINRTNRRFVDPVNGDDGVNKLNTCMLKASPCRTLMQAVDMANVGDLLLMAVGIENVLTEITINKNIFISGGWNPGFTQKVGVTQLTRPVTSNHILYIPLGFWYVFLEGFSFRDSYSPIGNSTEGLLSIQSSMLIGNKNGISNSANLSLENVTISQGGASDYNGPALSNSGFSSLNHVTITDRHTADYWDNSTGIDSRNGIVEIRNSIVARNWSMQSWDCQGQIVSLGNNIIGVGDGCNISRTASDLIGSSYQPVDPKLDLLYEDENGVSSIRLLPGSPAIDSADPGSCPSTDQRGVKRPDGAGCDIGAYEGTALVPWQIPVYTYAADKYQQDTFSVEKGALLCKTPSESCTGGLDRDADNAQRLSTDFIEFLRTQFDRKSLDNAGMSIYSYIHSSKFQNNAAWMGVQVVYGNNFPNADDVVAHELSHGVNQFSADLFYYYQSGAINESFSDLWGEYFDQKNGFGTDDSSVKWLIGEDLPAGELRPNGAIRSMSNPTLFLDPDKMSSKNYFKGYYDNGGVHWNSGINNKAVFLMVDGGLFNKKSIQPLGWEKTAAIYYYTQTRLLTSGADYADLYNALSQACYVLINGADGITAEDCIQVHNALDAVEMNRSPSPNFNPEAPVCDAGATKDSNDLFFDDFEHGTEQWVFQTNQGTQRWQIGLDRNKQANATSGRNVLYANDYDGPSSDTSASIKTSLYIPKTNSTYLYFNHAYTLEYGFYKGYILYIDGGMVEYSINNGVTWIDINHLYAGGQRYNGKLYNGKYVAFNPLRGRSAFSGESHGYVSSRYNLTSLAGKNVLIRWRLGVDSNTFGNGWYVDDVDVYSCVKNPTYSFLVSPTNGSLSKEHRPKFDWADTANAHHYDLQIAKDPGFVNLAFERANILKSEFLLDQTLADNSIYYWRVRARSSIDVPGVWSKTFSFRTGMLAPVIQKPETGQMMNSLRPVFEWRSSPGVVTYTLMVSLSPVFGSTVLKVTVTNPTYQPTKDLPAGKTLYWRVMANGANPSAWSAGGQFVTPRPPSVPALLLPGSNALLGGYTTTLQWKASVIPTGAALLANYQLQLDDNGDFSSPLIDRNDLTATSLDLADALADNQKYFWRVRSINTTGDMSAWSTVYILRTPLITPTPESPANASAVNVLRPTFTWTVSPGASSYNLMVSAYPNLASPILNVSVPTASYLPTKDLPAGKTLYWRVRAVGVNPSLWSAIYSLSTPRPPSVPGLAAPQNNALLTNRRPSLAWKPSTVPAGAANLSGYELQVDDTVDFTSPLVSETGLSHTMYSFATDLADNTQYIWRVRACNTNGDCSSWGAFTFRTSLLPPVAESPLVDEGLSDPTPLFNWGDVNGAVSYTLAVSTSSSFSGTLISTTVTTSQYQALRTLPAGKPIYWRVRANGPNGPSLWSDLRRFQVE